MYNNEDEMLSRFFANIDYTKELPYKVYLTIDGVTTFQGYEKIKKSSSLKATIFEILSMKGIGYSIYSLTGRYLGSYR